MQSRRGIGKTERNVENVLEQNGIGQLDE